MAGNGKRIAVIVGGAVLGGLVLDNWSGANALGATGFTGTSNLLSTLRSGHANTTSPAA